MIQNSTSGNPEIYWLKLLLIKGEKLNENNLFLELNENLEEKY